MKFACVICPSYILNWPARVHAMHSEYSICKRDWTQPCCKSLRWTSCLFVHTWRVEDLSEHAEAGNSSTLNLSCMGNDDAVPDKLEKCSAHMIWQICLLLPNSTSISQEIIPPSYRCKIVFKVGRRANFIENYFCLCIHFILCLGSLKNDWETQI